ncbi:hypothetical protein VTK26DRAFT_3398 [Humicola hyalothermophila]
MPSRDCWSEYYHNRHQPAYKSPMATFAPDDNQAELGSPGSISSGGTFPAVEFLRHTRPSTSSGEPSQPEKFKLDLDNFLLNECNYRDDWPKQTIGWARLAAIRIGSPIWTCFETSVTTAGGWCSTKAVGWPS